MPGGMLVAVGTRAFPVMATQASEDTRLLAEGRTLIDKGDDRTALILLKKAVKANPNNPEARFELGVLEFRSSDFIAAEKELVQARENGFPDRQGQPIARQIYLAEGKFQQLLNTAHRPAPTTELQGRRIGSSRPGRSCST